MKTFYFILIALALAVLSFFLGRWTKPDKSISSATVEVHLDSTSHFNVEPVSIKPIGTITAYLPVVLSADVEEDDEPMDDIEYPYDNPPEDSVAVQIPISRYVAEKDSLYRVVADGYAVKFREITVYPKTVTITNTIETKKNPHWGIGIQAGYGATLNNNTVQLSPYVGVGISYNILTW